MHGIAGELRCRQYRLTTLFLLVALVSVPLALHTYQEQQYHMRLAAAEWLYENGDVRIGIQTDAREPSAYRDPVRSRPDWRLFQRDEIVSFLWIPCEVSDEELSKIMCIPTVRALAFSLCDDGPRTVDARLKELSKLPLVEWIDLQRSAVTDGGVGILGRMRSLRMLNLEATNVSGTTFGNLSSVPLEDLNLRETRFNDRAAVHLKAFVSLRKLNLSYTDLSDLAFPYVGALRALRSLQLNGTNITDEGVRQLGKLTSIENLGLGWTKITGAALAQLAKMKRLKSLLLAGNEVGDESLRYLVGFHDLKELFLSDTHVSDDGIETLQRLRSLRTLALDNCEISDAGLLKLAEIKSLRTLRVTCTTLSGMKQMSITAGGIARFKVAMPAAKVRWTDESGVMRWD